MKRNRKTVFALLLALAMVLGLAATAGATEVGGTVVLPPEFIPQTPNEPMDPSDPVYKIPFTKTVKLGGNTHPGETDFKLEIFNIGNSNADGYKDVTYTAAVTTNGAGSYDGELVISGPAEQIRQFVSEGFFVREVNDNLSGWTYSDAVWCVEPEDPHGEENVRLMKIYPATMEKGADGEFRFYKVAGAAAVDKMTFENTYTYNTSYTTPDVKPTSAPKTFDAGVALYGVSALLSLSGTALVIKRKKG